MCWALRIRPVWHSFEFRRWLRRNLLSSDVQHPLHEKKMCDQRHEWNEICIWEKCGGKAKHSARVCTNIKHSWWEKVLLRKPSVPLKTCWGLEENLTSAFYWVPSSAYTAFSLALSLSPARSLPSSTFNRSGDEDERLFSRPALVFTFIVIVSECAGVSDTVVKRRL